MHYCIRMARRVLCNRNTTVPEYSLLVWLVVKYHYCNWWVVKCYATNKFNSSDLLYEVNAFPAHTLL